jgi:sugar (pentulose or hexulose) kinase
MQLQPKQIYATGGVSNNPLILQILSDVHNCEVFRSDVPKSTALGAALRAAYAYFEEMSWQQITQDFTKPVPAAKPNQEAVKIYKTLIEKYKTFEQNSSQLM